MGLSSNDLTFKVLRRANLLRLPEFRNVKGQIVHSVNGHDWSPAQWLQALVGEVGEYANWRKKYEAGSLDESTFLQKAREELADILIYLDLLAHRLNLDLGEIAIHKFNATSLRVQSSVFIDHSGMEIRREI